MASRVKWSIDVESESEVGKTSCGAVQKYHAHTAVQ